MTIAVTGGNGEFGAAVIGQLKQRAHESIIATAREPGAAHGIGGVEYRPGNFEEPSTLQASLSGVDTILVNATFFGADPSRRASLVTAAIDAAVDAGVGRIVLTSWLDLENATSPTVQNYRELEGAVQEAGPRWTILRLGAGLADALARDVVWGRKAGELVAPAAAARATPAAITDLAEAAAVVLTGAIHDHAVLELTGPDSVDWDDLAALAGVPFRNVSESDYLSYVAETFGLPEPAARDLIALYADFRGPWAKSPTNTLSGLLGRPATPAAEVVEQRVALFPAS